MAEVAMRIRGLTKAIFGLALTVVSSASAKIVDFTYHGTVAQLTDPSGVFGRASSGDPYTLVFRADTARGAFISGGGGYTDGVELIGGSNNQPNYGLPTITLSPVSAVLRIDGKSLVFRGANLGQAAEVNSYFGTIVGNPSENSSSLYQSVADQVSKASLSLTDFIESSVGLPVVPFTDPVAPLALNIDGVIVGASSDFNYLYQDNASGRSIAASGTLTPTDLVVADVPEPGGLALFMCSIGMAAVVAGARSSLHRRPSSKRATR